MKEFTKSQIGSSHFFLPNLSKSKTKLFSTIASVPIEHINLILCTFLAAALLTFFLLIIKPLLFLPADILMFAETDFVGNIIKLNIGEPLYTNPSDSNSIVYNPAAFIVTYVIAFLTGQTKSVVGLRLIQIGFITCATLIATISTFKLQKLAFPDFKIRYKKTWAVFIFLSLFLAATAPTTNKFVYTLHVDAFSLLISMICFWALIHYAENESTKNLIFLSILPAVGFLTKQSLVVWIFVIFAFLFFNNPKNLKRLGVFLLLSISFTLISFGACYAIWGDNYIFWTYEVLASRNAIVISPDLPSISITRIFDHIIRVWQELFIGIIGCWLLLKHKNNFYKLGGFSIAWLILIASQAYSSGSGWGTLYHFGPGVLIGAIFLFAAFPRIWEMSDLKNSAISPQIQNWMRMLVMSSAVVAIFIAWGVMPTGDRNEPRYLKKLQANTDVNRYVSDIEKEFENVRPEKILIGVGNWMYLKNDILQKDRAISLADQPPGGIYENFDVTVGRIRNKTYEKLLLQDFHSPYFFYEWEAWAKPTGFKDAVLENYVEVRIIKSPQESPLVSSQILLSGPVSVFLPRE